MKFRASQRPAYAAGFPETDAVVARRLRAKGDVLRRTGAVVLSNGTNAFTVDLWPFKKVSVEGGDNGIFNITGRDSLDPGAQGVVLANFGSQKAAQNGYAALMRAHSGLRASGASSRGVSLAKWGGGLFGLFCAVVLFSALTTPMQPSSVAANSSATDTARLWAQATEGPHQGGGGGGGGFNPNEPTLEDLASGKYEFQPKLKAPDIAPPTLNCAPKK